MVISFVRCSPNKLFVAIFEATPEAEALSLLFFATHAAPYPKLAIPQGSSHHHPPPEPVAQDRSASRSERTAAKSHSWSAGGRRDVSKRML